MTRLPGRRIKMRTWDCLGNHSLLQSSPLIIDHHSADRPGSCSLPTTVALNEKGVADAEH